MGAPLNYLAKDDTQKATAGDPRILTGNFNKLSFRALIDWLTDFSPTANDTLVTEVYNGKALTGTSFDSLQKYLDSLLTAVKWAIYGLIIAAAVYVFFNYILPLIKKK